MNRRFMAIAAVALTVVTILGALTTWRLASATGPDVNDDGRVTSLDMLEVAHAYGRYVPTVAPTATPTPVPTPNLPSILGNRALITRGNFADIVLIDSADGSIISMVTGPLPSLSTLVIGTSCDGKLGATSELLTGSSHRVKIVDMEAGAVLASADVPTSFHLGPLWATGPDRVLFPCPLKGEGGRFETGSPQADRAVLLTDTSPCCTVTVYNLGTGQSIFSDLTTGGIWLNCANDMLMYGIASNEATNLARLADGALIGSVPGYPNVMPTC